MKPTVVQVLALEKFEWSGHKQELCNTERKGEKDLQKTELVTASTP